MNHFKHETYILLDLPKVCKSYNLLKVNHQLLNLICKIKNLFILTDNK